ncbi:MAG: hemolysin family protein [Bacteroidales bacterium]|nr:hemolysin family protein [Bacteroidales bacterium]
MFADVPHWGWIVGGFVAIPILIALNGFFVAAEFALVAVRKTRVEEMIAQGIQRAKAVEAALHNLDRSIAATQLGITLASIALGWVGERAMEHALRPVFAFLPEQWAFLSRHAVSVVVAFSTVTFLHVVFGELIPKAIALQSPDRTSLWIASPLNVFARLSRPIIWGMNGTANWLVRRLGYVPTHEDDEVHSVEELRLIVEDTEEAGLLDPDAADVVLNVFALSNKTVADAMVPWDKVAGLELNSTPERVMEAVREGAHTRMPVYHDEPDNIVGIVNTKDLFYLFSLRGVVLLEDALYEAQFLAPNEPISTALRLFRRTKRPMAIIREPESRKVIGILTLEDVLEEIIGDIEDEHDDPTRRLKMMAKLLRRGITTPRTAPPLRGD